MSQELKVISFTPLSYLLTLCCKQPRQITNTAGGVCGDSEFWHIAEMQRSEA